MLSLQLLGAAEIRRDEQVIVAPASAKARALFYYVAMVPRIHTRTHLASLLWGDYPEEAARGNLRKVLSELDEQFGDFLTIDRQHISVQASAEMWVDAVEFAAVMGTANAKTLSSATVERIQQALDLYQGDFLNGFYVRQAPDFENWMLGERARLRQLMIDGLERVAVHFANQANFPQAIANARRLLSLEPWREETHRQLMMWLAQGGQRSAALAQYAICRQVLVDELAVEPSQATQQLYARLQRQEIEPPPLQQLTVAEYPLVGRQTEWHLLLATWHQVLQRGAHLVALVGEVGIGKTRLANETLMWVQRLGHATASTRAYPLTQRLAYGAVAGWLRSEAMQFRLAQLDQVWLSELARLLPELLTVRPELPASPPLLDRWQQKRFFEALGYAFTSSDLPLVLVLDDLQWCDTETLEWLPYFLSSVAHARIFVVATVRLEEVDQSHPLHHLWRTLLREEQLTTIRLGPLSASETAALAATVAQQELSEQVAAQLHRETAGSPLFIVEQMRTRGLPDADAGENSGAYRMQAQPFGRAQEEASVDLPPKVVAVLQARLAQLSLPTYALAQVAACAGRAFGVELLAAASLQNEEAVVNAVDELWQRHLVQEVSTALYDFSHEHIRTVVYHALSPVRRQLLHHRLAQALERHYAADVAPIAGELGFHYERAGRLEQAAHAYHQAADAAKQLYAYTEVAGYLERALAVLDLMPTWPMLAKTKIDLLHELGVARIRTTGWGSASVEEAWQQAHELAQQAGTPFQQCRALHALDYYQRHRGQWQHAREQSAAALALAHAQALDDPFLLHNLLGSHGVALYHIGAPTQALVLLEQAITLSNEPIQPSYDWYASHPQLMALLRAAHCLWLLGFADQARAKAHQAVEEEQKFNGQRHAGFVPRLYLLDFSAMLAYSLRDVAQVQALGEELIELGSRVDLAFYLRAGQMYVGWALAQQGDVEVGLHLLRESVATQRVHNIRKFEPTWRAMLADVLAMAGDVAQALQEVDETLAYTSQSANRYWDAHLLTQKADFLQALGAPAIEVEHWYQQALAVACQQGARALELRVVVRLSRLWQQQRRIRAAYQQVTAIIESFTEGHDTPDLRQAKALLDELHSYQ